MASGPTAACNNAAFPPELALRSGAASLAPVTGDPALFGAWDRLESSAKLPTQSRAFCEALQRTLLRDQILRIVHMKGPSGIAAVLPLCRHRGFFARWRIAGASEVYEPNDALCENAGDAVGLAEVLVRDGRPVSLDRIPADSPLIPAFRQVMKGRGIVSVRPAVPCPTIALDESWGEPEMKFNSGRRSDFRRALKKVNQQGEVLFEVLSPRPDAFDTLFDEAVEVEVHSWKKEAGTAIAVDEPKQTFFRDYFRAESEAGNLRIAFMRIDGKAVAMQMAVERAQRYWLFKIGFDEAYAKCSPGTLLMLHTLGDAARRGLHAYELLGDAEAWIARFWTQDQHECVRLRTYPLGLRGAVAFAADAAIWLVHRLKRRAQ